RKDWASSLCRLPTGVWLGVFMAELSEQDRKGTPSSTPESPDTDFCSLWVTCGQHCPRSTATHKYILPPLPRNHTTHPLQPQGGQTVPVDPSVLITDHPNSSQQE
ncbi:hypothetical protein H1C71_025269, partial [Ictidomys tridecemlineatus]